MKEFTATVQWSMTLAGLAQGELDVLIRDYDGTSRSSFTGAWVLDRGMSIEVDALRDESGPVQQDIDSTSDFCKNWAPGGFPINPLGVKAFLLGV